MIHKSSWTTQWDAHGITFLATSSAAPFTASVARLARRWAPAGRCLLMEAKKWEIRWMSETWMTSQSVWQCKLANKCYHGAAWRKRRTGPKRQHTIELWLLLHCLPHLNFGEISVFGDFSGIVLNAELRNGWKLRVERFPQGLNCEPKDQKKHLVNLVIASKLVGTSTLERQREEGNIRLCHGSAPVFTSFLADHIGTQKQVTACALKKKTWLATHSLGFPF